MLSSMNSRVQVKMFIINFTRNYEQTVLIDLSWKHRLVHAAVEQLRL